MSLDTNALPSPYGMGITVRNVNEALPLVLPLMRQYGIPRVSRGIETLELNGPFMTVYKCPAENVLFDPVRDCNPFFHFFESMWILSGSQHIAIPQFFLNRIGEYSDDGVTSHGAYGYRLRANWTTPDGDGPLDQMGRVVDLLREKPDTRQAVMSIWDPARDLGAKTRDMPCNDMIMFKVRDGRLDMTVCNRSNDAIWGAYGANAVQFSVIQAWVAARLNVTIGYYTQVSDSMHVYVDNPLWKKYIAGAYAPTGHVHNPYGPYGGLDLSCTALFDSPEDAQGAMQDAEMLDSMARKGPEIFSRVAMMAAPLWKSTLGAGTMRPMFAAFVNYKNEAYETAYIAAGSIQQPDWRIACQEWILRRANSKVAKA